MIATLRARSFPGGPPSLVILLALCVACGERRDESPGDATALFEAWRAVEEEGRGREQRDAVASARELLDDVSMEKLYELCRGGDTLVDADAGALAGIVAAKLELDGTSGPLLAAWLGDSDLSVLCRGRALRVAQRWRGEIDEASQAEISRALLEAAARERRATDEAGGADGGRVPDWEVAAAQFGATDEVLALVGERLGSGDDRARARGVVIARESRDPRVADALLDALRRAALDPSAYEESGASLSAAAARLVGTRALLPLERLVVKGGADGRRMAVRALGHLEHPRAVELLVWAAAQAAGEAESEGADAFARREYQQMYDAARRLERYLLGELAASDAQRARNAFIVLDEATSFGPLVRPHDVRAALLAYREVDASGTPREAVDAVIERLTTGSP